MMRLLTSVLVATAAVTIGCSSGEPAVTTTATSAADSPTATATPRLPGRTITAVPTEVPTPEPPDIGVAVMDVATGDTTELYRGSEWVLSGGGLYPQFAATDSAVWFGVESWGEARRVAPDGELLFTVDGWGVIESDDGLSRSYYLLDADRTLTRNVAIERGGVRRMFEGWVGKRVFSPDGEWMAFVTSGNEDLLTLVAIEIATGLTRALATEIGACGCDGGPSPRWSMSGDYLAHTDFDYLERDGPGDSGSFVVHVGSGEIVWLATDRNWLPGQWARGDTIEYRDGSELWRYHAQTGARELIATAPEHGSARLLGESYIVFDETSGGAPWSYETALVERTSGREVGRWPGIVGFSMAEDGPALLAGPSRYRWTPQGCIGFWVEHPLLAEPECFSGATWARWSPDISKIAVLRKNGDGASVIEVVDFSSGARVISKPIDAEVDFIRWDDAGTHVLASWGIGL